MTSLSRRPRVPNAKTLEWQARVGAPAALQLKIHSITLRVGWWALAVGAPTLGLGIAFFLTPGLIERFPGVTAAVTATGLVGVIVWGSCLRTATWFTWVQAVGQAAQILRPRVDARQASELSRALRSTAVFDEWSSKIGIRLSPSSTAPELWTANTPRPILRGPTARRLFVLTAIGWFGVVLGLLTFAGAGMTRPYDGGARSVVNLIPVEAAGAFFLVCAALFLLKDGSEYRAGYTTRFLAPRVAREIRTAVDLVEYQTGYLLRAAGEAGLTKDDYWYRRALVRTEHRGESPLRATRRELTADPRG